MLSNSRRAVALWLTVLVATTGCAQAPSTPPAVADWTVLYYAAADCNLEGHMMDDLGEIAAVGSTPKVQVVALVDRSPKDSTVSGYSDERLLNLKAWAGARLLHPLAGQVDQLQNWGPTNMADGATLQRFLKEGVTRYPAHHYLVILSGHGAGPDGMAVDDDHEDDLLTPQELAAALKTSQIQTEVLGLDACLMSHLEVALALTPYAQVLIASQESEPEAGWDYAALLRALNSRPDMSAIQVGGVVSKTYQRSFDAALDPAVQEEGKTITLSVIQLSKVAEVDKALQHLATVCLARTEARRALQKALKQVTQYGRSDPPEEDDVLFYDLHQLAQRLLASPPLKGPAQALLTATDQAVCSKVQGQDLSQAGGLSVGLQVGANPHSPWSQLVQSL